MRRPPAVARVLERVTRTVREHEMFRAGDTVLVSVSGGPDSVCLLYSLWHLRRLFHIRLEAFHFDHRLRRDSVEDVAYVRRVTARLSVPLHLRVAGDRPTKGASVEAWATARRMSAANDVRHETGAAVIAEGHTLDDQAETVLLNLIRGGGLEAIAGIWPGSRSTALVQPLLHVGRDEVEDFCRALRLRPRVDPTNRDLSHLRNAIRWKVIPAIERSTGREVKRPIARSADLLSQDREELHTAVVDALQRIVTDVGDERRLDAEALRALPQPLASRVVRRALYRVLSLDDEPWSREAVEAVLDLARGRPGRRRDLGSGLKASRDPVYVVLSRASPESRV